MIGKIARKYLSQHREPAVGGRTVSATYVLCPWEHVNQLRIELLTERLISELVTISAHPGAGAASALGLVSEVEHQEGRIIVTFSLCNSGEDRGCH